MLIEHDAEVAASVCQAATACMQLGQASSTFVRGTLPTMIIAIASIHGGALRRILSTNLAVLRARSGRKVVLLDTNPSRPACRWSSERNAIGVRPFVSALALSDPCSRLEQLHLYYNDIVIDAGGRGTTLSHSALASAGLVLLPVDPLAIDLASQYMLIRRLNAARSENAKMRVLVVIVTGVSTPSADALAAVRAFRSRIACAALADTVLHVWPEREYGAGRCLCDAETCDPESVREMQALFREVYARPAKQSAR